MASNSALAERNIRVAYARTIGVDKPHTLKKDALEAAIAVAEDDLATMKAAREAAKDDDPFDDIDPTIEGDHLTEDVIPEAATVMEAVSLRDSVREVWLIDAVDEIKNLYRQAGFPEVDKHPVLISTGFPQGNVRKVIGQCHAAEANEGVAHIFINPTQDDTFRVLEIITHELAHAPGYHGHTGDFKRMASAFLVGTGGKGKIVDGKIVPGTGFTSTDISRDHVTTFMDIEKKLGPYPHTKVNVGGGVTKKQTTRMLKAQCTGRVWDDESGDYVERGCHLDTEGTGGYVIRLTKKWAELGTPTCPCGGEMILEDKSEGGE